MERAFIIYQVIYIIILSGYLYLIFSFSVLNKK